MTTLNEIKAENQKFSLLTYANALDASQQDTEPRNHSINDDAYHSQQFQTLVKEIRQYFISVKSSHERDKHQLSDLLNRAILGYSGERQQVLAMIQDQLVKRRVPSGPYKQFRSMADAIFAEVIGLSVLELLLEDRADLEEIQVIGTRIFEVRKGTPHPSVFRFQTVHEVERLQQNLVLLNQDIFNPRKRWAEVMLLDGSRVTMTGFGFTSEPTITIRFYAAQQITLRELCAPSYETLNEEIELILRSLLEAYFNLVIIGSTNSGKTQLIKTLIQELPDHERIITIESRLELMLRRDFPNKNIIEYEVMEDDTMHNAEQAFKLALRQSPKRICHAEIRDEDANMYVRACTRGHDGSMTTVHVSALEDVPDAITDMCMQDGRSMNADRLMKRITEHVAQIGIEMAIVDGKRKLIRCGELCYQSGNVVVRDIVRYDKSSKTWLFPNVFSERATSKIKNYSPEAYAELKRMKLVPV